MKSFKKTIIGQGKTIIYLIIFSLLLSFNIIILTHCFSYTIQPLLSPIPLPPRKLPARMCKFIKPKKPAFTKKISKSLKHQIKPLLSKEIEQSENL